MDSFERVIAALLERQGYWTTTSLKVELTKAEKVAIGRPSSPRWELDVVGYRGQDNHLRVVECKSYLDSIGVQCAAFDGSNASLAKRYKLFCDSTLRRVVLNRLKKQLVGSGFCAKNPSIELCLAAGKIKGDEGDEAWLYRHFEKRKWTLFGPRRIRDELAALQNTGYENSVAAVVTKLLLRNVEQRKG